jgi:opacity protein-like surface antigen
MKRLLFCACLAAALTCASAAADVTGTWQLDVQLDQGSGTPTMTLKQEGAKLTGKFSGQFGESEVTGTVDGDSIRFDFTVDAGGAPVKVRYQGKIQSGSAMQGTCEYGEFASGKWTARKK